MTFKIVRVMALVALATTLGCSPGTEEVASNAPDTAAKGKPSRATGGGGGAEAGKATAPRKDPRKKPPAKPKFPAVGMMADEISGPDTDGVEFNLSDYRGKVVMLDFWGHW